MKQIICDKKNCTNNRSGYCIGNGCRFGKEQRANQISLEFAKYAAEKYFDGMEANKAIEYANSRIREEKVND